MKAKGEVYQLAFLKAYARQANEMAISTNGSACTARSKKGSSEDPNRLKAVHGERISKDPTAMKDRMRVLR
jgi:hypothetical protein